MLKVGMISWLSQLFFVPLQKIRKVVMIFLTGNVKKIGKFYLKYFSGWPRNYKNENDGMDWWAYQFHIFPFITLMMDDENIITFGWLFWSAAIIWERKSAI